MDTILSFISENIANAHWIMFGLLLLSGLNIPISEDVILIGGGALASVYIPESPLNLYLWLYFGCLFSGWEAYWIGRLFGPKLHDVLFFKHLITVKRMDRIKSYLTRFGTVTFFVGRFIPGGFRSVLLICSGWIKMPFPLFVLRDGSALILSSGTLFFLGYQFGENSDILFNYLNHYAKIVTVVIASVGSSACIVYWYKSNSNRASL